MANFFRFFEERSYGEDFHSGSSFARVQSNTVMWNVDSSRKADAS